MQFPFKVSFISEMWIFDSRREFGITLDPPRVIHGYGPKQTNNTECFLFALKFVK